MANDFKDAFTQRELMPPSPQFKPYVPPVSDDSPEALAYVAKHGEPFPSEIGNYIRQGILEAQLQGPSTDDDLFKKSGRDPINRPLVNFGAQNFDSLRNLALPFNLGMGKEGLIAAYVNHSFTEEDLKQYPLIYDTIQILGEGERLINDFMITTPRSNRGAVNHELIHRAFSKLKQLYKDSAASDASFEKFGFVQEDAVQLLDFISGGRRTSSGKDTADWYFDESKEWTDRHSPTTPEEILKRPGVLELLVTLQQLAVEELKKQNIDTPINFGDLLK